MRALFYIFSCSLKRKDNLSSGKKRNIWGMHHLQVRRGSRMLSVNTHEIIQMDWYALNMKLFAKIFVIWRTTSSLTSIHSFMNCFLVPKLFSVLYAKKNRDRITLLKKIEDAIETHLFCISKSKKKDIFLAAEGVSRQTMWPLLLVYDWSNFILVLFLLEPLNLKP